MSERFFSETLPSTQSRAIELLRGGAGPGTYVVAREQSAGRGRGEHQWYSPRGGLYLSWIGPDLSGSGPAVSLALAASMHRLLSERWNVPSELKWPNDLVCPGPNGAGCKIAGILPERLVGPHGPLTVIGLGLNVTRPESGFPPELAGRVALIEDFAIRPPPVEAVERTVVEWLEHTLPELSTAEGIGNWLSVGRTVLFGRGRAARVDGVSVGRIVGIQSDGALWLDGPGGPSYVRSGELLIEEPA